MVHEFLGTISAKYRAHIAPCEEIRAGYQSHVPSHLDNPKGADVDIRHVVNRDRRSHWDIWANCQQESLEFDDDDIP